MRRVDLMLWMSVAVLLNVPLSARATVVSPYARAAAVQRQAGIAAQQGAALIQRQGHGKRPRQPANTAPKTVESQR